LFKKKEKKNEKKKSRRKKRKKERKKKETLFEKIDLLFVDYVVYPFLVLFPYLSFF